MSLFDVPEPNASSATGDLCTTDGLLRLLSLRGIGPRRALTLATTFGSWSSLSEATEQQLADSLGSVGKDLFGNIGEPPYIPPAPSGIVVISCFDETWPAWLTSLPSAPAVVYVRGTLPSVPCVAVVGTRHPTAYGLSVVSQVVERAGVHGFGVVSGLAAGIDAAGHQAALDRGVLTWAILGGGVDAPTPKENVGLAEAIVAAGGGLISEQAPGVEPNAARLVARNRLQVAASQVVVAAQSGIPSGTLQTVRFAIEQNKTLAVPRPRPPWDIEPQSAGNMALTDPDGCNPEVLSAKGSLADKIRRRRPAADLVLTDRSDIDRIWTTR